jgi:NAD(P)-dependent dehydrogenase (short-subunit alcohol dehydrogenase family)
MSQTRVWLITGSNSGFGTQLVKQILARGDKVVATARNPANLSHLSETGAHLLKLDVTSPLPDLHALAKDAVSVYGRIDVLINNAGYIQMGTVEESSPELTFQQFNTNVFGLLNVSRAFLPYMRAQRSGTIVNIGSIGGYEGAIGFGLYNASKFAVAAMSDSMRREVEQFGIEVYTIEPGYFATSLLTPGHLGLNPNASIPDYEKTNKDSVGLFQATSGNQMGDPRKGAARIIEAVTHEGLAKGKKIPHRLVLGKDAYKRAGEIFNLMDREREEWKEWSEDAVRDNI